MGFQREIFSKLEKDPLFRKSSFTETLDETRRTTQLRARRIFDYGFTLDTGEGDKSGLVCEIWVIHFNLRHLEIFNNLGTVEVL